MNFFKIWMLSLCGATAITSLFRILLSNSSLNKVLNVFFTLFVLFYTVMPMQLLFNNKNFDTDLINSTVEYSEFYKEGYEEIIEVSIKNECEKENVNVLSCNISSYIKDNYLHVDSIEISIDNYEKNESIKSILKERLGYEVIVIK